MKSKLPFLLMPLAIAAFALNVRVHSQPETVKPKRQATLGLTGYMGYVVDKTAPGSPTEKAGLRRYDVILSINKISISSPVDLQAAMAQVEPGEPVEIMFIRYSEEKHDYQIHRETVKAAPRP